MQISCGVFWSLAKICKDKSAAKFLIKLISKMQHTHDFNVNLSSLDTILDSGTFQVVYDPYSIKDRFLQPWMRIELYMPVSHARKQE